VSRVKQFTYKGEKLFASQYGTSAEVFDVDGLPYARLSTYVTGDEAPAGFFFCKAYSENTELVQALIEQGTLIIVGEPIFLPPFGAKVYVARINSEHEGVQ